MITRRRDQDVARGQRVPPLPGAMCRVLTKRRPGEFPPQRMLPTARSDEKYVHRTLR